MNSIRLNIDSNINAYNPNDIITIVNLEYRKLIVIRKNYCFKSKKSMRNSKSFIFNFNRMKDFFRMRLFE